MEQICVTLTRTEETGALGSGLLRSDLRRALMGPGAATAGNSADIFTENE